MNVLSLENKGEVGEVGEVGEASEAREAGDREHKAGIVDIAEADNLRR